MLIKETRTPRGPLHQNPTAIRQARDARHVRQAALAEAVGVSPGHISEIEGGTKNASVQLLARIAEVLNCPVDLLERRRPFSCPDCGYGYDEQPDHLIPLHTRPKAARWCPSGGQSAEVRSAA